MGSRRLAFAIAALSAGCALVTDLTGLGGSDASVDAGGPSFSLAASPAEVITDPGDPPLTIGLHATRVSGFDGLVTVSVSGSAAIVQPQAIASGASDTSFQVSLPAGSYPPVITLDIAGTSGTLTAHATLTLHVGSLVEPDDAGVVTIPAYAHGFVAKAWGAGGGCGLYGGTNCAAGSTLGGGGGYASATFAIAPATLNVVVGTAGQSYVKDAFASGAGGGFSGVKMGSTWLLIAGGGGGGGGATAAGAGGHGGGTSGLTPNGPCAGAGGTATAGGAAPKCSAPGTPGSALQGGPGATENKGQAAAGGAPGGGAGGTGGLGSAGGGGGGGWFGGGGGAITDCTDNSGGGGSGHAASSATNVVLTSTSATAWAASNPTDPDYAGSAGTGCNQNKAFAYGGRVIVRLLKP